MANDHLNDIALIVMYIGLFGWILSAAMFVFRGFARDGRFRFRRAIGWFISIFVGILVWIAGMVFLGYKV